MASTAASTIGDDSLSDVLTLRPRQLSAKDLCLGGGMSSIVAVDVKTSTAIVHACLRAGIRDFDSAPLYGQGESEQKLGKALLAATEDTAGGPVNFTAGRGGLTMTVGGERVAIRVVRQLGQGGSHLAEGAGEDRVWMAF